MLRTSSRRARFAGGVVALAAGAFLAAQLAASGRPDAVATASPPATAPAHAAPDLRIRHPRRLAVYVPANATPAVYVRDGHHAAIRTAPGAGKLVADLGPRTDWGSRTTLAVTNRRGTWAQVVTPDLPNGQPGWIKLDNRRLGLTASYSRVDIDLSARRATLITDGRPARSFSVSIGAPGTDTPVGRFAVTDTFRGLRDPAYGCCALALTAHQPSLPSGWLGGNRIAIHGTFETVGYAVSHGCVRAANADVRRLVSHVPIGSLVDIHQ